jgi:hypothetical protein
MAGETEFSQRVIRVIQRGDKLVRDVRRDVGQLLAAAGGVKEILSDIKDNLRGQDDGKEV